MSAEMVGDEGGKDERREEWLDERRAREKGTGRLPGMSGGVLRQERQRWERLAGPERDGDIPQE